MFQFTIRDIKKEIEKEWDVIIIGGGPAGLSSAIYCGRYKLKTLVITKEVGGLLLEISKIENYPGFKKISGKELAKLLEDQAKAVGAYILIDEVIDVKKDKNMFIVITKNGFTFTAKALIFATGSKRKSLGVPGENLSGISYCAECDAPLYKDKIVGVVGGSDTAFHDALVLAEHAKKVYIIHRREEFRAEPKLVEQAKSNPKIEFLLNKVIIEIKGTNKIEKVLLRDIKTGEISELKLDGLFVAIGLTPASYLAKKLGVKLDEKEYIIVDSCMQTNIPGVFAAGDITTGSCMFRQIVTAVAEGAIAALSAFKYIRNIK